MTNIFSTKKILAIESLDGELFLICKVEKTIMLVKLLQKIEQL